METYLSIASNLCSTKKLDLITHLEALGALPRVFKDRQKLIQVVDLTAMTNRILRNEETIDEKEARLKQQDINFVEACDAEREEEGGIEYLIRKSSFR
jgi:hypothetical protein